MRSRKFMAIALAAVTMGTLAAFASCGSDKTTVTLSGSTSVQPLMEKLGAAFEEAHGDIEIVVNGGGSGVGVSDTQTDKNDFGMASRELKDSETGIKAEKIATDGIAIIVNTGCTLDNVTPDEVYGLYAEGTAIGTVNAAISRESGSGTRGAFDELVKNSKGKTLDKAESFAKCVQTQNSTGAVITQISTAGNTNLIGYISLGSLSEKVKALKYNGVEATVANIESGAYKLSRPFLLLSKEGKTLSEAAQKFHDFIFSAEGQAIVEKDGYIKAVK